MRKKFFPKVASENVPRTQKNINHKFDLWNFVEDSKKIDIISLTSFFLFFITKLEQNPFIFQISFAQNNPQKQLPERFYKKSVLKNFAKFTGKRSFYRTHPDDRVIMYFQWTQNINEVCLRRSNDVLHERSTFSWRRTLSYRNQTIDLLCVGNFCHLSIRSHFL